MFKDEKNNFDTIISTFEKMHLKFIEETKKYRVDIWHLKSKWNPDDIIQILWHKKFTKNTTVDDDDKVELLVNDVSRGNIDLARLRVHKHSLPLQSELESQLISLISGYLGFKAKS
ncbi:MAG: hypothetical protein KDC92_13585 [Bacteroidetes bacterium]|nr:hypothetical protein [Bacteroidota bacterium]